MNTIGKTMLAAMLACSVSVAVAGDRIQTQGRSGFRHITPEERERTVALYTEQRREMAAPSETDREGKPVLMSLGRQGFVYRPVAQE
jgi:hypothetical protein